MFTPIHFILLRFEFTLLFRPKYRGNEHVLIGRELRTRGSIGALGRTMVSPGHGPARSSGDSATGRAGMLCGLATSGQTSRVWRHTRPPPSYQLYFLLCRAAAVQICRYSSSDSSFTLHFLIGEVKTIGLVQLDLLIVYWETDTFYFLQ